MNVKVGLSCLRGLAFLLLVALAGVTGFTQTAATRPNISYSLEMSKPASHLFEVSIKVSLPAGHSSQSIEFQMPKWSPGRYSVFDFAKNVQEVKAFTGDCPENALCKLKASTVERVDDQTWRVGLPEATTLNFTYKIFGDDLSGTFSQLNEKHASFNGGSVFMYIVGHKPDPVRLKINPPQGWRIVNGRMDRADQSEWEFPNYDILIDTPTEVSPDFTVDTFKVDGKQYNVAVHSLGKEDGKRPELVRNIEKIVRAETTMWGPPEFDSYTFLIHFAADGRSGDGMEHLTSTQIIEPGALGDQGMLEDTLGTVAHEFFHVWNVKRLRPIGLGPWDFTRDASTRGLWVAEGFTNYYGHVMQRRAGIWSDKELLEELSRVITNVENNPGTRLMSAVESSLSAPFIDGAPSAQKNNLANTSVSYYFKGECIALVLDSLIRKQTGGRASLDDVMRQMYDEFYIKSPNDSYYLHGKAYDVQDVERVASKVAGINLHEFFEKYVWGVERLPYEEALQGMGLKVSAIHSSTSSVGVFVRRGTVRAVMSGSPADAAGIVNGDQLLEVGGTKIEGDNLNSIVNRFKAGEQIPVALKRNGEVVKTSVIPRAIEFVNYKLEPANGSDSAGSGPRTSWFAGTR